MLPNYKIFINSTPEKIEGILESQMILLASLTIVSIIGIYLIALGLACIFIPSRAKSFLLGFADSAAKHYTELFMRFLAGGGLIVSAPQMKFPAAFTVSGWVFIATTFVMLLIPWRTHEAFAKKTVPAALKFLPLIGVLSLLIGALVAYSIYSK